MEQKFRIDIPNPCKQSWDKMTTTKGGKFCDQCSAEVVDFSKMNLIELRDYFKENSGGICGRVKANQLSYLNQPVTLGKPNYHLGTKIFMVSSVALLLACDSSAQLGQGQSPSVKQFAKGDEISNTDTKIFGNKLFVIKGLITKMEDNTPVSKAIIRVSNSDMIVKTDQHGKFKITVKGSLNARIKLQVNHFDFMDQQTEIILDKAEQHIELKLEPERFIMGEITIPTTKNGSNAIKMGNLIYPSLYMADCKVAGVATTTKTPRFFKRVIETFVTWFTR